MKALVEVWRDVRCACKQHLSCFHETFNDFKLECSALELFNEDFEDEIDRDWMDIRDDSLPTNYNVLSYLQNTGHSMDMSIDAAEDTLDVNADIEKLMPNPSVSID